MGKIFIKDGLFIFVLGLLLIPLFPLFPTISSSGLSPKFPSPLNVITLLSSFLGLVLKRSIPVSGSSSSSFLIILLFFSTSSSFSSINFSKLYNKSSIGFSHTNIFFLFFFSLFFSSSLFLFSIIINFLSFSSFS